MGFAAMCQLASQPSALTMRFLFVASHLLHSGFLQTMPRDIALAFGSWLSLLTMSPSRYYHRGLAPHKFGRTIPSAQILTVSQQGGITMKTLITCLCLVWLVLFAQSASAQTQE